uniref:Phosphoglycerate mutase n=1 Tax=Nemalion vermiculare TaxID=935621 RepID=UPI00257CF56A|nr:Phosphoglycerate mutase [Nemalion vermiculare]WGV34316.1 Phosphoglycerate mutase [Nemalion vermiculare]
MTQKKIFPVILAILDGWGLGSAEPGNAIHLAHTPTMDKLQELYPSSSLSASGTDVGLPTDQVGNSEVGHTSIGGGRTILQDLVKITSSIEDQSFYKNTNLNIICRHAKENSSKMHLIGLCSDGGVHSHIDHLLALLDLVKKNGVAEVCIHFIADGRDTQAKCAANFVEKIERHIALINIGKICTISGRYYAMDRDCRWSRTEAFYKILTNTTPIFKQNPYKILENFYQDEISDEFIIPTRLQEGSIEDGDAVIFFNFRPDRMRQIVQAIYKDNFKGFLRNKIKQLPICTFTQYDSTLDIPIAFHPVSKINFLGEVISNNNLKQLRVAETEKYAHVTYFFNGGIEEPFAGEDRELISSPQVTTYDQSPDMSAKQITQSVIRALDKKIYSFIVVNYANPDMVGHTGQLQSTIKAVESVDKHIKSLTDAINKHHGAIIITADHGNAECMIRSDGEIDKSHTTNLVPFILITQNEKNTHNILLHQEGSLKDIAPTIIDLLGINKPFEMTGNSLIERSTRGVKNQLTV